MKRTELDAGTRDAAISMIRSGFAPEQVVEFVYLLGHMNGGLDMVASIGVARIAETVAA
jgi:hypothetical protein